VKQNQTESPTGRISADGGFLSPFFVFEGVETPKIGGVEEKIGL
jgi:hypothetical protein